MLNGTQEVSFSIAGIRNTDLKIYITTLIFKGDPNYLTGASFPCRSGPSHNRKSMSEKTVLFNFDLNL